MVRQFVFDATELGAALALAGVRPDERSSLPDVRAPAQPIRILRNHPILTDGGERLSDDGAELLRLAAAPRRLLSSAANVAGEPRWRQTLLVHDERAEGPFAAVETRDGRYQLALLSDRTDAIAWTEELLGLPELPQPDAPPLTLSLVALATLLAAADAVHATRLRMRLPGAALPVLTPGLLDTQINRGLSQEDTRRTIVAARRACPADLSAAAGRMATGLTALANAGIARPIQRGYGFTPLGARLATAFSELVRSAGFTLTMPHHDERMTIIRAGLLGCASGAWILRAEAGSAGDRNVCLTQVSRSLATDFIRGLIDELLAPIEPGTVSRPEERTERAVTRRCPSCGQVVNKTFCTGCGARVPAQERAG